MRHFIIILICSISFGLGAQVDSTALHKLDFTADFRFRVEHDWHSRKPSGEFRDDRSRLRYRFRFGLDYALDEHSSFGGRIRSGNLNDQQGPHLTLGGRGGEFSLTQIGFEKLFYQFQSHRFLGWVGKNSIPLKKLNEMFWNDNVFVEGVGLKYALLDNHDFLNNLSVNAGHFIIRSNNQTFGKDSYLQMLQFDMTMLQNRVNIFPGIYVFRNVGNFPDGKQTFNLDYSILHLGAEVLITNQPIVKLGVEYYHNLEDYSTLDSIPALMKDEKSGIVISAKYGKLKKKGDLIVHLYYSALEKFSIVDYFAQNDWVRWDYSSIEATGARISNFHGIELRIGYAMNQKYNLILRTYWVEELINLGPFKENGSRIRLDLNIGF